MEGKIKAEWERLRKVITHKPGIEIFFGLLEPYSSLYERGFSHREATIEHDRLEHVLKYDFKVSVQHIEDIIISRADKDEEIRQKLIEKANNYVNFSGDPDDVKSAKEKSKKNEEVLDSEHYFNIMLMNPLINLEKGKGAREINLTVTEREPAVNLYFMRDQQAVTDKGVYLSRMGKPQRRKEPEITSFLWDIMGVPIAHKTEDPGTFEGGDFIPMKDFALIGLGDRTNRSGVEQMLKFGLNFDEVGVVHQPSHPLIPGEKMDPMINMHIDTYFDVASSSVAIGSVPLLKRAKVEIFHKENQGVYTKEKEDTNLFDYMKGKGFNIINLTTLEQLSYASNFLCIKDGQILAVDTFHVIKDVLNNLESKMNEDPLRYSQLYEQAKKDYQLLKNEGQFFPHKKELYQYGIDVYPINVKNLTGGYGGPHCMTCAFDRD